MSIFYKCVILMLIVAVGGCAVAVIDRQTAANTVEQAKRNYDSIKDKTKVQQEYANDLREAYESYVQAQKKLDVEKNSEAFSFAQASLSASNRIITQLYGNIAELAKEGIKIITERIIIDPDSPLKRFLPRLNEILSRAERIQRGEQIPTLGEFLTDLKDVNQSKDITTDPISLGETIGDVLFELGKYTLSDKGKQILEDQILEKITTSINQRIDQYPNTQYCRHFLKGTMPYFKGFSASA